MGIESTLLPTRFLLTTVHLMAILTLFNSKDANIRAALPISYTTVQYSSMNNQMLAALWIAVVCFIVEYLGMFSGVSIMKHAHNSFYVVAHFIGAILIASFALESWNMLAIWYVVIPLSLVPALLEASVLAQTVLYGSLQYM